MSRTGRVSGKLRPLIIALFAFVLLGLIDGALGVAWPSMRRLLDRGVSDLGLLLAFGSVGYLLASLVYGQLHRRAGTGYLLSAGAGLLLVGLVGVAVAPSWIVLIAASLVLGLGGGLVDTGMNAHAALAFDVGSINLLHACYGVGATLGPLIITISLVTTGIWRSGYVALVVLQGLSGWLVWRRRGRWAASEPDLGSVPPTGRSRRRLLEMLTLFFLYTGIEVGAGQWAFSILSESRGMSTAAAGAWVAIYWGGLTVGRLGFGMIGDRLPPRRVLDVSLGVSIVGLAVFWLDPVGIGYMGLPVAGFGLAAIFPTMVSLTPARIGIHHSTSTMGYQLAAASLGAAAIPWMLGGLAEVSDLEVIGAGIFVTTLVLAAIHLLAARVPVRGQRV